MLTDELHRLCGINDLDVLIVFEFTHMRISGDDEVRLSGERTGEQDTIIGVVLDVCRDVGRDHVLGEQRIAMSGDRVFLFDFQPR